MFRQIGLRRGPITARKIISVGDQASVSRTFDADAIAKFALVVGDDNPIHLSDEAAKAAGFARRVAHGTLSIGVISNVLGTQLPGPQSIYLQQKTEFVAPVLAGETVTATVKVKEFMPKKSLVWLDTTVTKPNPADKDKPIVVIKGYALMMNKAVEFKGDSTWTFAR